MDCAWHFYKVERGLMHWLLWISCLILTSCHYQMLQNLFVSWCTALLNHCIEGTFYLSCLKTNFNPNSCVLSIGELFKFFLSVNCVPKERLEMFTEVSVVILNPVYNTVSWLTMFSLCFPSLALTFLLILYFLLKLFELLRALLKR